MKREILFRGRCIETMEWICGFVHIVNGRAYIKSGKHNQRFGCGIEVDPETIGQFTGLLDKNGVKIFEGDVINIRARYDNIVAPVVWHGTAWNFKVPVNAEHENPYRRLDVGWYGVEVICNIHDKKPNNE